MTVYSKLANNVEFQRLLNYLTEMGGMSQKQVAMALDIDPGHLSRIKSGQNKATDEHVEALRKLEHERRLSLVKASQCELIATYLKNNSEAEINEDTRNAIFAETEELIADEAHLVSLPEGIRGAVVKRGNAYVVVVDCEQAGADYDEVLAHELRGLARSLVPDVDSDHNAPPVDPDF